MKVLNLYAGIGGNRRLWDDVEVTAVEWDSKIAAIYQKFFPEDRVVVADAHQYLLDHYSEFDFIWASPPCQTHSQVRWAPMKGGLTKPYYPDLSLYQEIIFLQSVYRGKYCVENVVGYYEPLIKPQKLGKHYFWANFIIKEINIKGRLHDGTIKELEERKGFCLDGVSVDKEQVLRNCVEPELGKAILESVWGGTQRRFEEWIPQ